MDPIIASSDIAQNSAGHIDIAALPDIALSLVTYRSAEQLPKFFASLLAQSFPTAKINLLITQHSDDPESDQIIGAFIREHGARFKRVVQERRRNRGFGAGHNANFQYVDEPYFVVSNVDLEYLPDTLPSLVAFAERAAKTCAAVEARQYPFEHPKFYNPATFETSWISCCLALFRSAAFAEVDGFDEVLFMYGEDVDISLRLRRSGYRLAFNPYASVHHDIRRDRDGVVLRSGILEANLMLRVSDNPLHLFRGAHPRNVPIYRQYVGIHGPRKALHRAARLAAHGVGKFVSDHVRRRRRVRVPVNDLDYEWRRPYDMNVDEMYEMAPPLDNSRPQPLVSIMIRATENAALTFEFALRSALYQTYRNCEVVVVEDGSSIFARICRRYADEGFRVHYFSVSKVGRAQACNLLLSLASGAQLMFLDDDDFMFLDHVERLVAWKQARGFGFVAAWSAAVQSNKLQNGAVDQAYLLPDWYRKDYDRERMSQINYFPIQSVLFDYKDAVEVGRVNSAMEFLEDWNFYAKLVRITDGAVMRWTTSCFRVPYQKEEIERRMELHRGWYEKAREDILVFINRSPPVAHTTPPTLRLLYHRIGERVCDPFGTFVTPANFSDQMRAIKARMNRGMLSSRSEANGNRPRVEISFDDGYAEIAPAVHEALALGIDTQIFITGHSFGSRLQLPWDEYHVRLVEDFPRATAVLGDVLRRYFNEAVETKPDTFDNAYRLFCETWRSRRFAAEEILAELRNGGDSFNAEDRLLDAAALRELADAGCRIGAHGDRHVTFTSLGDSEIAREVQDIRRHLEPIVGTGNVKDLAFPYGGPGDFNEEAVGAVLREGIGNVYSCLGEDTSVGGMSVLGRYQVGNLNYLNFTDRLDEYLVGSRFAGPPVGIERVHFCRAPYFVNQRI